MRLSEVENTIANRIINSDLQERMNNLSFEEIKAEFLYILNEKETSISEKTLNKWENNINKIKSKFELMSSICNLILAADGFAVNSKNEK